LVHIAGRTCITLLDNGATTSSIPEELVADIYNRTAALVQNKVFGWEDQACPIKVFEDFSCDPRRIEGLAKDQPITVTHTVILRVMFVPIGAQTGPVRAIRMKVLPKGASSFPGIILSAPCLAPAPRGLGLRTEPHAHVLQSLGVCLPRLEEEVEASLHKEMVQVAFMVDTKEGIHLGPGDTALVPVRASRTFAGDLEVKPGGHWGIQLAAEGPVSETAAMLFITNTSGLGVDLEMGHAVATGQRRGETCTALDYWSSSGSRGCVSPPACDAEKSRGCVSPPASSPPKVFDVAGVS
jgi:hypothetical protein